MFIFGNISSQNVGINTSSPVVTLDVVGSRADATKIDGMITPRISLAQLNAKVALYNTNHRGTILYIDNSIGNTVTSTAQITTVGYYYFDGVLWKSLEPKAGTTIFTASLGSGAGGNTNFTVPASVFTTVTLPNVSRNVGGGIWSTANNTYQVPVSGIYIIKSTVRMVDGSTPRNVYQTVHTSNADIPDGVWQTNALVGAGRFTMLYNRIAFFNKGDLLRLVFQSDGAAANISDASLNISLLSVN